MTKAGAPIDRFYNFSVGSDYAGTLLRPDSLAQLRTAVNELGFRYVRSHSIFHDARAAADEVVAPTPARN